MHALDSTAADQSQQQKSTKRHGADLVDRNVSEDPNITPSDIRVILWLNGHSETFLPSYKTMADKIHMAIGTVAKSVKNLIKQGYLIVSFGGNGAKNRYRVTLKISGGINVKPNPKENDVSKNDTLDVSKIGMQRKSNKGKAINIHDVVNDKHEPVVLKPIQTSSKKLGFKLAKAIHGSKGYDFDTANNVYSKLLDKYGVGKLYPAMKLFITDYLKGNTVKFCRIDQIISEIPHILEKYGS